MKCFMQWSKRKNKFSQCHFYTTESHGMLELKGTHPICPSSILFLFAFFLASSSPGGQKEKERPAECQLVCETLEKGSWTQMLWRSVKFHKWGEVAHSGGRCISGEEGPQALLSVNCLLSCCHVDSTLLSFQWKLEIWGGSLDTFQFFFNVEN